MLRLEARRALGPAERSNAVRRKQRRRQEHAHHECSRVRLGRHDTREVSTHHDGAHAAARSGSRRLGWLGRPGGSSGGSGGKLQARIGTAIAPQPPPRLYASDGSPTLTRCAA